jgi:hypothetical protein
MKILYFYRAIEQAATVFIAARYPQAAKQKPQKKTKFVL